MPSDLECANRADESSYLMAETQHKHSEADVASEATERPNRRADILDVAEKLFAQRGYQSVSIRDIASAAAVPINLVRYYFGRKEELFGTIFEAHRGYIDERAEAIRHVGGPPGAARARRIIRAWVDPVLRERSGLASEAFAVMVARTIWEAGDENRRIVERYYDPLAEVFIAAMCDALPDADRMSIVWNYQFALGALLIFIADDRVERLSGGSERTADPARGEQLIRFITTGFLEAARRPRGQAPGPSRRVNAT